MMSSRSWQPSDQERAGSVGVQRARRLSRTAAGVRPLGKVVLAVEGDVVRIEPEGIRVNGEMIANSRTAVRDRHGRPVPGFLAYRATIHAEGADEMYPMLHLPPSRNEAEADIWRDENFNNHLAYEEGIGSIEPITCLDALLFAEQNARVPQLDRPTEFLASVLRRRTIEQDEAMQPSARSRGSALVRPNTKPHSRSIPYRYYLRYLLCKSCNDDFGCRIEGFATKAPAA